MIAGLLALSWILALIYFRFQQRFSNSLPDSVGARQIFIAVLYLAGFIFFLGFLSGALSDPVSAAPKPDPGNSGSTWQWLLPVGVLGILLWQAFLALIRPAFCYLFDSSNPILFWFVWFPIAVALGLLISLQIAGPGDLLNNFFMLFVVLLVADIATRLSRGGLLTLFSLIMLLDIYLVWMGMAPATEKSSGGESWYIAMIKSDLMQHWPFPLGFRWNGRILGNGDIFLTGVAVVYALRVWRLAAAVVAGLLMTAPLIALPYLYKIWPDLPTAWPYTIFIAPVAILIALLAPRRGKAESSINGV